jgi:hypothetical protein
MRCGTLTGSAHPVLLGWPDEADRRAELAEAGVPRLLVIDPGTAPPPLARDEDWIVRTSDERDVAARLQGLARSPRSASPVLPPVLPADLSPAQHRIAVQLASPVGRFVPVEDLASDAVADGPDALDTLIERLRPALAAAGYRLTTVGTAGYLLEHLEATEP